MEIELIYSGAKVKVRGINKEILEALSYELVYEDKKLGYLQYKGLVSKTLNKNIKVYIVNREGEIETYVGLKERVKRILKRYSYKYQETSTVEEVKCQEIELPNWLYKHQIEAVEIALKNRIGLIKAPTGSGKSTIAAYYAKHFPNSVILLTVPQKALMYALRDTLERILGEEVGLVGDNVSKWKRVTVGIINSLVNDINKEKLKEVDIRIVDECHYAAADMYIKLAERTPKVSRSIGFTATNWRTDGKDILLEGAIGPTIYEVSEKQLSINNVIVEPTVLRIVHNHINVPYPGAKLEVINNQKVIRYETETGKPELLDVYKYCIVNNKERNEKILQMLKLFLSDKKRTGSAVILTKYIEHGEILSKLAKEHGLETPFILGKTNSKKRLDYLDKLNKLEINSIIATSILNEGVDIPTLECIILADPSSNAKTTIQRIGRVMRTHPNKTRALVLDIYDKEEWYFSSYSYKRNKIIEDRYKVKTTTVLSLGELQKWIYH